MRNYEPLNNEQNSYARSYDFHGQSYQALKNQKQKQDMSIAQRGNNKLISYN